MTQQGTVRFWRRAHIALALAVMLVFLPSLATGFVLDDEHLIVQNPYVRGFEYVGRALSTHLWDVPTIEQVPELLRYYRPLVTLSYIGDFWLFSGRPLVFHLTNVLLHGVAVSLSFVIGRRWLRHDAAAALAALVFALHPTRTESVIWVSGRPDLLATVAVLLWLQLCHLGVQGPKRAWAWPLSLFCLALGLLSKEIVVAAPVLLTAEMTVTDRTRRRELAKSCALAAGMVLAYLVARAAWMPIGGEPATLSPRHALVTIVHYAERVLLPWPQTFYFRVLQGTEEAPDFSPIECLLGFVIAASYGIACVLLARRRPLATACFISAVAFLGPLLNVTKTGSPYTTCDRFLYLPLWLLSVGILESSRGAWNRLRARSLRLLTAGILLAWASVDVVRTLDFLTPEAFWSAEIRANPSNPVARGGRASILADAGNRAGALTDLAVALSKEARRSFTLARPEAQIAAYLLLLRTLADELPDGAANELDVVGLELLRILASEPNGSVRTVRGVQLGYELDDASARYVEQRGTTTVALTAAPVLSRLERRTTTTQLLDLIPDSALAHAARPLEVILAEAREERFEQARRRLQFLAVDPAARDRRPSTLEVESVRQRLAHAEAAFTSAHAFGTQDAAGELAASLARAEGFAHLGAYLRALVALGPRPAPAAYALRLQLLVAARLEQTALLVARRELGDAQAQEVVLSLRADLPASLQALSAETPAR